MADMMKKRSTKRQAQIQTPGYSIDWERIRDKAAKFARDWKGEKHERAEAQSFWNDFFGIFGRNRRGLALYEYHARIGRDAKQSSLPGRGLKQGRIDLLWPEVLAVEHKSAGKSLEAGKSQLMEYIGGLTDDKKPLYGLVCNFARFLLIDINAATEHEFPLCKLPENAERFNFFIEHERKQFTLRLKASQDAADVIGKVYEALAESDKHHPELDRLLMRLLFCMFADSTGVWEKGAFADYLLNRTNPDGGDLGAHLELVFDTLNTHESRRPNNLHSLLRTFPYVNGGLFADRIRLASFDGASRAALLEACGFDWSGISPDIFGALFQTVRDPAAQREGGEHYTSEENILKVIRPLFLDNLEKCLLRAETSNAALNKLHSKIAAMRFLDPACGCGNFLIVAYRELRRLEAEILLRLYPNKPALDIKTLCRVNVDQFYGIEVESFPARIAETALWLVDHQINLEVSKMFGGYWTRIPLTASPGIVCGNALAMEWGEEVAPPEKISYIFGNPPFVGDYLRQKSQKEDMARVFNGAQGAGSLDYVCAWYAKAASYIRGAGIECAFVSTNSVTQGSQVAPLWNVLRADGVSIRFAHRTFRWMSKSKNCPHVEVVIIGFGEGAAKGKTLYCYQSVDGPPEEKAAANINAYLMDAPDILIESRSKPLCDAPPMVRGSGPTDDGNFLFSDEEKRQFLMAAPQAAPFIRRAVSGKKYLHGENRWCLWLADAEPSAYRKIRPIMERVNRVQEFRKASNAAATRKDAARAHLFQSIRQPKSRYILVPRVCSEKRDYYPIGFVPKSHIALDSCIMLPGGDMYHFGVLSSAMHMAWVRVAAGRLKSDYRYSNTLVYNTFPWPEKITAAKKQKIKECAQKVLDMRKRYPGSSLGDMYSSMPPELERAHRALDLAVDRAYRRQPFASERNRMEYLFSEYHRLTAPVIPPPKKKRTRRRV